MHMHVRRGLFFSFWAYPLLAAAALYGAALVEPQRAPRAYLWLVPAGLLLWTLIEYGMHRFLFHWTPAHSGLERVVDGFHRVHHRHPREPGHILARPRATLPLSIAIWSVIWTVSGSPAVASGLMTGIWAGFLYYEWVHYRIHTSNRTLLIERARRRHFQHHFVDDSRGFGVTSPLWDYVFGTTARDRPDQRKRTESNTRWNVS